jgi:membrane-bound metal-dependent hydrolase YbcI (DUF457 family)
MAQAGLHALVGAAVRKVAPRREWVMTGILLGSLFPDLDNYAVAFATLLKMDTHGLHRTFTHSLFTCLAALVVFLIISAVTRKRSWAWLGAGFAIGIGLHILLDLVLWFNGVAVLWPIPSWINLWEGVTPPAWLTSLLDPLEFLFLALYFYWLSRMGLKYKTDPDFQGALKGWTIAMLALLVIFVPLAYLAGKFFLMPFGLFYLVALTAAFVITIRMRKTVEAFRRG